MFTVKQIQATNKPGWYGQGRGGHGLTLVVAKGGTKQRVQRLWFAGRMHTLGLGSVAAVSLTEAKPMAAKIHRRTLKGKAPKSYRQCLGMQGRKGRKAGKAPTFAKAVDEFMALKMPTWKDAEAMARQWRQSLAKYAYPSFGNVSVADISTQDVLAVIEPIWASKRPMANAVLRRICKVLDRAKVQGHRADTIAAKEVTAALPANGYQTKHHAALPHGEVKAALASMMGTKTMPSVKGAIMLLALTATRSAELREAHWAEFDLGKAVWTIPAGRMKAKREHRIPLSHQAVALLEKAKADYGERGPVFPGKGGRVVSADTLRTLTKPLNATVHGFRSSFRDWAAETDVAKEVAEACLAHTEQDKTVAAYARSDLLEARQGVMQDWADYLDA